MTDPGAELALRAQPVLPMSPDQARDVMAAYQEMCRSILTPDDGRGGGDLQRIGDKDHPKRSAMQKLSAAYGVSTEIVKEEIDYNADGEILRAKVTARAIHPTGRHADGDGSCTITEKRFRKGDPNIDHNVRATAVTRAKNRAIGDLIAFGAVTAEEIQGEQGASTPLQRPDWALPMNDIAGVATNLTRVLQAAGIEDPAPVVKEIGNTIFKQCGGEFPFIAARVAGLLANAVEVDESEPLKVDGEIIDETPDEPTTNEETE